MKGSNIKTPLTAILVTMLAAVLLLGASASARGAEIGMELNGQPVTVSHEGGDYLLDQERLLVAVPWLEKTMGFGSSLSGEELNISCPETEFELASGSPEIWSAGKLAVLSDIPARLQDGLFYVPLRSLLEAAGYAVYWREQDGMVLIAGPAEPDENGSESLVLWTMDIVHTNDIHSHWEHMPQQAAVIKDIQSRYPDSLLLNAGDNFVGTLYFSSFPGQADRDFMNALGYDATLLGNHEFDKGSALLAEYIAGLNMPVLASNVDTSGDSLLAPLTLPGRGEGSLEDFAGEICPLLITTVEGQKVGIMGLSTPDSANDLQPGADVEFTDPADAARQAVASLEGLGVKHIVALSHIGWAEDIELAGEVAGIDLIIGGHSHTVPELYPALAGDEGAPTLVVQAGYYGERLGELHVAFDRDGRVVADQCSGQLIATKDGSQSDPEVARLLAGYDQELEPFKKQVAGQIAVDMPWNIEEYTVQESLLANLVAESFLEAAQSFDVDAVLVNTGCVRSGLSRGELRMDQVLEVLPYGNELMVLEVTGSQLREALENGVSKVEENGKRFPAVAGLRFSYDPARAVGSRITGVEIAGPSGFEKLDEKRSYRLLTLSYLAGGGDGYTVFAGLPASDIGIVDFNAFSAYIGAHSPVEMELEGRITRAAPSGPTVEVLTVPEI